VEESGIEPSSHFKFVAALPSEISKHMFCACGTLSKTPLIVIKIKVESKLYKCVKVFMKIYTL